MPKKDSSVISGLWDKPAENGITRINLIFNKENDGLPVNIQVGTTCGIYALHAAANVLGKHYATPARKQQENPNWRQTWEAGGSDPAERPRSMRSEARSGGPDRLSQIGEINGAGDMQELAARLGIKSDILTFADIGQLWGHIISSVDAGHAIVFPYTAANSLGEVATQKTANDFTHWALVCGYATTMGGSYFVFMTTYGGYHMDHVAHLYNSNMAIQDWSAQKWIKLHL